MARALPGTSTFEHLGRSQSQLYVHTCGRLEAIEASLHPTDVCAATRRAFDLPIDQEISLLQHDGKKLSDVAALSNVAENGETIYAQLPSSALHDFERRIDQLQHLQIGYLCDQFATFRHEHTGVLQEVSLLRSALEKEHNERRSREDVIRRSVDEMGEKVDAQATCVRLSEQRVREQLHDNLSFVEVALKRRDEPKLLQDGASCMKLEEIAKDHKSMATEVQEMRKALETERIERRATSMEFASVLKELQTQMHSEEQKIPGDVLSIIEASVESERLARQKALTELTQQLSIAVESIQEEQMLRSSEDSELTKITEGLRASIDEIRHRQNESDLQSTRFVSDMTQRLEEATRARATEGTKPPCTVTKEVSRLECEKGQHMHTFNDMIKRLDDEVHESALEISKLQGLVCEERLARQKNDDEVSRMLGTLEQMISEEREQRGRDAREYLESVRAEKKERMASVTELLDGFSRLHSRTREQSVPQHTTWAKELRELVEAEKAARVADYRSIVGRVDESLRLAREFEVSAGLVSQLLHTVSQETKDRKHADDTLGQKLNEVVKRLGVLDKKILEESGADSEVSLLREGLAKVVEALQQERHSRQDHDAKLRNDCCETVQKEVIARLERDTRIREDMNAEIAAREEAIKVVEAACSKCRDELENLTRKVAQVPVEPPIEKRASGGTVMMHERSHVRAISPAQDSTRVLLRTYNRSASPNSRIAREVLHSPTAKLRSMQGDVLQQNIALTTVLPGGIAISGCEERSIRRV